jgi:hypothetical protein
MAVACPSLSSPSLSGIILTALTRWGHQQQSYTHVVSQTFSASAFVALCNSVKPFKCLVYSRVGMSRIEFSFLSALLKIYINMGVVDCAAGLSSNLNNRSTIESLLTTPSSESSKFCSAIQEPPSLLTRKLPIFCPLH